MWCAGALATESFRCIFPSADAVTSSALRSLVIARGSPQLLAQLQALGKLPAASDAQACTPFADSTSSQPARETGQKLGRQAGRPSLEPGMTPDAASEILQHQLVQPASGFSRQTVIQMFCTATSPGEQTQAYQPAFCSRSVFLHLPSWRRLHAKPPLAAASLAFSEWF